MGNGGSSSNKGGGGYHHIAGMHHLVKGYHGYAVNTFDTECCPPVVDLITLGTLLAGIAAATLILNQLVIDNIGKKRRRRRRRNAAFEISTLKEGLSF